MDIQRRHDVFPVCFDCVFFNIEQFGDFFDSQFIDDCIEL